MRFSKQEYWHGLPFPSPEDLPNPGIEPWSPALQADSSPTELQGNMLSRFLIASVLRRKHLLMSWLQLPSAVILETQVQFLGQEDLLEKEMATHSSIPPGRIPWTEEPGRLQSMGLQELDTTERV